MENRPVYSAEIAEIIGTPPQWLPRVGSGLLLLLLLLLLGAAAAVKIPESSESAVRISGTIAPYYLVAGRAGRPLIASGQVVAVGQRLARRAPDSTGYLRAPFRGTLFYEPAAAAAQPGDTIGLLVPVANTYRFNGQMLPGQIDELRQQPTLELAVPLDDSAERSLALRGRLGYVTPMVRHGLVAYTGQLDSASSALLGRHLVAITTLDGTLLVARRRQSLLRRFFR